MIVFATLTAAALIGLTSFATLATLDTLIPFGLSGLVRNELFLCGIIFAGGQLQRCLRRVDCCLRRRITLGRPPRGIERILVRAFCRSRLF